jgi:hypothetical protein
MTQKSWPWPAAGSVGDGMPYTDEEWRTMWRAVFGTEGALRAYPPMGAGGPYTAVAGANDIIVSASAVYVDGGFWHASVDVHIAPTSAPAGETRKCAVILSQNHTTQTIRASFKVGTAGAYPAMTQTTGVLWEMELAKYIINDAGVITGLTDTWNYAHFGTEVNGVMLANGVLSANAAGRLKMATGFFDVAAVLDKFADYVMTNRKHAIGARFVKGMCIPFSGTFTGHFPNDPDTGVVDSSWHLCNGDTQNGVVTPNLADKFVIAGGGTYAAGSSGGAATKNLAHTHAVGSIAAAAHATHTHPHGTLVANASMDGSQDAQTAHVLVVESFAHTHPIAGDTGSGGPTTHTMSGTSASGGSATQDIMPPYYSLAYICYVGA